MEAATIEDVTRRFDTMVVAPDIRLWRGYTLRSSYPATSAKPIRGE